MNTFTMKDVKALATEIAIFFNSNNDKDVAVWLEIVRNIRKEYPEIKEIILELLGPYVFSFPREACKKIGLTDLIFETSLEEMPLYLESENKWELIVARWRLAIDK